MQRQQDPRELAVTSHTRRPQFPGKEWVGVSYPLFRVFAWLQFIPLWTSLATLAAAPFVGGTDVDKHPGFPRTGDFQHSSQGSPGQTQMTGHPRTKHTLAAGNRGGQGEVHLGEPRGSEQGLGCSRPGFKPSLPQPLGCKDER